MAGAQGAQGAPAPAAAVVKAEEQAGASAVKPEDGQTAGSSLELEGVQTPAEPQAQAPAPPAKRGRRREREAAADAGGEELRWGLKRKIAALSRDVELLSREVARVRQRADAACSDPQLTPAEEAAVAERHARRMAEAQKRNVSVLLRDIMSHKWAFPFARPVDTGMYRDYLARVAQPMDFGTIKARLDGGQYAARLDAFAADMRLVFQNAFTYNPPGSDVHAMASTLRDKFEERWKGVTARLAATAGERAREERELREACRRRLQEQALRGLVPERERLAGAFTALEGRCREAKSEAAAGCAHMTMEEKTALVVALNALRPDELEAASQLAVNRHPGMLAPTTEEFDLDLSQLDALTLRQLAAFARACARGRGAVGASGGARWPGVVFGAGAPADKAMRRAAASNAQPAAAAAAAQPTATAAAPGQATPAQAAAPAAAASVAAAQQAPATAPTLRVRQIGERSWSVLDRDARLMASAADSPALPTPAAPQQAPASEQEPAAAPAPAAPAAAPAAAAPAPAAATPVRPPLVIAEASPQGVAARANSQPAPATDGMPQQPQ